MFKGSANPVTFSDPDGLETLGDIRDPRILDGLRAVVQAEERGDDEAVGRMIDMIVENDKKLDLGKPFDGCGGVCAIATGVTALVSYSVAGGVCGGTLGVGCGVAIFGATGATSVVYEATSTDADGGDLV